MEKSIINGFGPDNVTIRTTEGATTVRGEWRVDDSLQELQTLWVGEEVDRMVHHGIRKHLLLGK